MKKKLLRTLEILGIALMMLPLGTMFAYACLSGN